jgi:glycosyltransferase involved in cell wall biosynthesis
MADSVDDDRPTTGAAPRVSVFMFVRNAAGTVRRAIESVLAQTYPNIEFLVQDAVSTDGTLQILRSYGEKVTVVSEPDDGPSDGLWRALNACTGEFIGSCLSDEELLPDAVEKAVDILLREPDVGALTGDAIITDIDGKQTGFWKSGPFNLIDYLLCDYSPYFCSTFFRRQALLDAGLKTEKWGADCIEFELWCRLATHTRIKYVANTFAKYAAHENQSSNKPGDVVRHFSGRLGNIFAMCQESGFIGSNPLLRGLFIWGHARAFINHATAFNRPETAEALYRITQQTVSAFPPFDLDGMKYDESYTFRSSAENVRKRVFSRIPSIVGRVAGQATMTALEKKIVSALIAARYDEAGGKSPWAALLKGSREASDTATRITLPPPVDKRLRARMYAQLALRYEANGRQREALEIWQAVAALYDLLDLDGSKPRTVERIGYTAVG